MYNKNISDTPSLSRLLGTLTLKVIIEAWTQDSGFRPVIMTNINYSVTDSQRYPYF